MKFIKCVQKAFFSEVSHAIDLKAEQMTSCTQTLTAKVEVTEIDKFNGRKNHRWRRRIKKKHDVPNNSRYRFAAIIKTYFKFSQLIKNVPQCLKKFVKIWKYDQTVWLEMGRIRDGLFESKNKKS